MTGGVPVEGIDSLPVSPTGSRTAEVEELSPPESETELASVSFIPFSAATTLSQALTLASTALAETPVEILALRFEDSNVVGEWNPSTQQSADEFLAQFEDLYATVPEVSGVVIASTATGERSRSDAVSPIPVVIETGADPFVAPPAVPTPFDAGVDTPIANSTHRTSTLSDPSTAWFPESVYSQTMRSGSHQYFTTSTRWGLGTPAAIPDDYGIEFEINTNNENLPGEVNRPVCQPGYKERSIAQNHSWHSWSVSSPNVIPATVHAYADYNDLSDDCGRNSMAIGLMNPQDLPVSGLFGAELQTFIDAPVGNEHASAIDGLLQLVSSSQCTDEWPWDNLTNCMGIPAVPPPDTEVSRLTWNPNDPSEPTSQLCWYSTGYGLAEKIDVPCPNEPWNEYQKTSWTIQCPAVAGSTGTNVSLPITDASGTARWSTGTEIATDASGRVPAVFLPNDIAFTVEFEGTFGRMTTEHFPGRWSPGNSRECYRSLDQWGDGTETTSMDLAFDGMTNLHDVPAHIPAGITSMVGTFTGAETFNDHLNPWNFSDVESAGSMFGNAAAFNQPLNSWDTSSLKHAVSMFGNADAFNQPLFGWDTSSVTEMTAMFNNTAAFNQPIDSWDTSSVTNFDYMFTGAQSFNQPIDSWDTSAVTNMGGMFNSTAAFNQPLDSWDTSSVTDMSRMFHNADAFNQPLSSWDTSSVTDMSNMFHHPNQVYSQDLTSWNVAAVTECWNFAYTMGFPGEPVLFPIEMRPAFNYAVCD